MTHQPVQSGADLSYDQEPSDPTHEITWDAATVWVNDTTGCCIGRFSRRGVDVHKAGPDQLASNSQCLDCIHDLPPRAAWDRFVASMRRHHGVSVPDAARPDFVRQAQA